ncbi:MAG: hydrogenase formation protein HypD [Desulfobacterales bacterium]|nr:hydrogenase formation protein HypD [Desulfobacterales bacterium]
MTTNYIKEYRDPEIANQFIRRIHTSAKKPLRLMEVCGTHTMSIFRNGIRSVLPSHVSLLSGPGCPVCVTAQSEMDAVIEIAQDKTTILCIFGDLMKIPGSQSSLRIESSKGLDIRVVYSSFDALRIAEINPKKRVVFVAIGFETTIPAIAGTILMAEKKGLSNFYIYSAHKVIPPALHMLVQNRDIRIDGFLLPGHVAVVLGVQGFQDFFNFTKIPCVVAGFEPVDILDAIYRLVQQHEQSAPALDNAYQRVVTHEGNVKAQHMMYQVFQAANARWRGLGEILNSGLELKPQYNQFCAKQAFGVTLPPIEVEPPECLCGKILQGINIPTECIFFNRKCTPEHPMGPCMVSMEGTCAAYFQYGIT